MKLSPEAEAKIARIAEACYPGDYEITRPVDALAEQIRAAMLWERERCMRAVRECCGDTVIEDGLVGAIESGAAGYPWGQDG